MCKELSITSMFVFYLLNHKNIEWLAQQRSNFVPVEGSDSTRNSLFSCRTSTRRNIGRPQARLVDELCLLVVFVDGRTHALKGASALSVGSAMREAIASARESFC